MTDKSGLKKKTYEYTSSDPGYITSIGLLILFSDIQKRMYEKYSIVDTRSFPKRQDIKRWVYL